jgi:hypothetical protein
MPNITEKIRLAQIAAKCPEGYTVNDGKPLDMLGKTELWRIHEFHMEPDLVRIPQDLVDYPNGPSAKRVPKEWGQCLYYKVV